MYNRDRFSPVSLAGEYPVTQFVVDGLSSDTALFDHHRSFLFQNSGFHAVPFSGIDHGSGCLCVGFCHIFNFFSVFGDNLNDRNVEFCCKCKVTVIMCRYAHDCSGTVVSQYIIRQPDRHLCSVDRIDRVASCENSGFFLILKAVNIRLHGSVVDIFFHCFSCLIGCKFFCKSMLRSQYHKCCAVKCIRSCCVDSDLFISSIHRELYLSTVGLTDPVCLHLLNLLRPVQFVQVVQKSLCIFGNLEHPLTEVLLCYFRTAALTFSIDNFLVCKSGLTGRAPVDRELFLVSKAGLKHLYKNPLSPFVEVRVCRVDLSVPVVKSRDLIDLSLDILYIFRCGLCRMNAHFDRVVFCRKSECIPSHRMNDIVSLKQFVTAPYIGDDISSPVSDMQTVS